MEIEDDVLVLEQEVIESCFKKNYKINFKPILTEVDNEDRQFVNESKNY